MIIGIRQGLPFVAVTLTHGGQTVVIPDVLLDTGSAQSLFKEEDVRQIGLLLDDRTGFRQFRGIGGTERVYVRHVSSVFVAPLEARNLEIGIGRVDYGFGIRGILGMDFLLQAGAVIDLAALELRQERG
jgi:hypothetical protein